MDKKILSAKESALSWIFAFTFSQVAVMVFTLIGTAICSSFGVSVTQFNNFLNSALGYFLTMLVLDAGLLAIFVFYNSHAETKIVSKPKFLKVLFYLCVATISFFMLYPIVACLDSLFVKMGAELKEIPYPLTKKNYIISVFSLALIPAICEELIFRGVIFKGLKKYGKAFSICISAVMFAIFHMSYQQFVYPFIMGLILAVIMYYENNIIYTIVTHFANNFLSLTISYFNVNLTFNHWAYILLAIVLLAVVLVVVGYFIFVKNKQILKEKLNLENKKFLLISFAVMIALWIIINIVNR